LITFLVMNSAHLRNPLSLEIIDEKSAGAKNLLTTCMNFVPEDFLIIYSKNSLDTLIRKKNYLEGKVIIGTDSSGFRRDASSLNSLLEDQRLFEHQTGSSEFEDISKQIQVKGPISCILITTDSGQKVLTYPASLKLILTPDPQVQKSKFKQMASPKTEIASLEFDLISGGVKQSLERMEPFQVEIPYAEYLSDFLFDSKIPHADQIMESSLRMISIITILHYRLRVTLGELYATLCGIDPAKIRRYMELKSGINAPIPTSSQKSTLTATKFEYFVFSVLMDGTIQSGEHLLNDRQLRVYEAIKRRNIGRMTDVSFLDCTNDSERLVLIGRSVDCWNDVEQIHGEVNKGGGEFISRSTLNSVFEQLREKGIIDRQKSKKKYVYAVTTLSVGSYIKLPHPREIDAPVYHKEPIQAFNPLTGEIETI